MGRRACFALAGLAALAAAAAASGAQAAQPVGPCQSFQVCRFSSPEDLVDLAGTPWILVSEQGPGGAGRLAAFDTVTEAIKPLNGATAPVSAEADGDTACPRSPRLHNGGMDAVAAGRGWRLAVVNHAEHDRIEFFRVAMAGASPTLAWSGCVAAPDAYFLNDVALMPDGIAASHMFDRRMDKPARDAALLRSEPTGFVVRWTRAAGWSQIPHSEASFTNGIVASPDGAWIAFAETYGHAVDRIAPDGSGRRRIPVRMQPDNLTLAGSDTVIVAGGTGAPMVSTRDCPSLKAVGCGFPGAAVAIDLATGRSRPLVTSGGASTPGPSVALQKGAILYLGTAFGDRITRLRPPAVLP